MQLQSLRTHQTLALHLLATCIIFVWGSTLINSKILLNHGLAAHEIFTLRFLFAYICILFISPRRLWADTWRDELKMLLLGVTGGSMYFVTENMAVRIDYVNNVSFIVCTAPLLTTLLALLFVKSVRATRGLIVGAVLATTGVAIVVFNGQFVLKLNPLGDLLAFCASLCWAVYSLLLRKVSRYSAVFYTRKVFGYGLLTILPIYLVEPWTFPLQGLTDPVVWGNLLFLGFVASFGCFVLWSWVSNKLGALVVSNYVYMDPISTVIVSALVLNEPMTWLAALGSAMILVGVYVSNKS